MHDSLREKADSLHSWMCPCQDWLHILLHKFIIFTSADLGFHKKYISTILTVVAGLLTFASFLIFEAKENEILNSTNLTELP